MFGGRSNSSATTRLTVHFGSAMIDTTVTRDAAVADDWVRTVRAANPRGARLIVGLDCEWKPNYRSWTTSKVAILQLCAGTRCLVLHLALRRAVDRMGCPRPREGYAVAIVFMALLFLLSRQGLCTSCICCSLISPSKLISDDPFRSSVARQWLTKQCADH